MTKLNPNLRWYLVTLFLIAVCSLFSASDGAEKDKPQTAIAKKKERAERQRLAVKAIQESSGRIYYYYEIEDTGKWIPEEEQQLPGTEQQRKQLGIDFFSKVRGVTYYINFLSAPIPGIEGSDLKHLKVLTDLQILNLRSTDIGDDGLSHLRHLNNLRILDLAYTAVSDDGLEQLMGMRNLVSLDLRSTKVTTKGVAKLRMALPNCKILHWK